MAKALSELMTCGHCGNLSHMPILGNAVIDDETTDHEYMGQSGSTYSILDCPACHKTNIISFDWYDGIEEDEIEYEILFPINNAFPIGLPDDILKTYKAAEKIKTIDVNAYALLLRRLLELVCLDRKAEGTTLAAMLKDLSNKGEIPQKLVNVAIGLKDFGNIGAHAGIGELSEKEIPIVKALCSAILEYTYSAPHLAALAETQLKAIKTKAKK